MTVPVAEAAKRQTCLQRIVILGNAGSGKSTLARQLGVQLALPVVHLDLLFWEAGWREPATEVFRERLRVAMAGDRWITEGNYARKTFDLRLPRADVVIWLDTPPVVCMYRVLRRGLSGQPRPDLPEGCKEKVDADYLNFLMFTWRFETQSKPEIEAQQALVGPHVPQIRLRGRRQVSRFLASL